MSSILETLNYSSSNEDSNSKLKAFHIDHNDSFISIIESGALTLDLLIKNPIRIDSIDFNPCQNHLLELKMAAIQHLEYQEFLEFLGVCLSQKSLLRVLILEYGWEFNPRGKNLYSLVSILTR